MLRKDYVKKQSLKRKRAGPLGGGQKRRRVVPGYTRQSGYYGRYSGGSGELKFIDSDLDSAAVPAAGTIAPTINIIEQGVTESQRVGRKCTIRRIGWKYNLRLPNTASTPDSADSVRLILYQDKQCNGATATVTGILESADYQSFNNLVNSGRFVTLMDRTHLLNASSGNGSSTGTYLVDGSFYKVCNMPIEYSGTTGALGEIRSNNLGILVISKGGVTVLDSKIRLRFSDS